MSWTLFGILLYVSGQLLVGVLVSRRIHTENDYLLAGRRFGYGLAIFSIFATWFGAETCIGAAGATYERGFSGSRADPLGYALCLVLMGAIFAVPLWRRKLTTLADLFRERYSPSVERLAVLLMVPTSLLWAAAQIRAFGHVLAASSDLGATVGIGIAAAVVIVYTTSGGLLADAVTDVVQGIALITGLVVLFFAVTAALGGVEAALASVPAERWSLHEPAQPVLHSIEEWAVPICGSLVAQELIARVLASRTPEVARRSTLIAASAYVVIGLIPAVLGLLAALVLPELSDPEQALPAIAQLHLSTPLYILFAGALVSAILSTVDSALLVSSSLVSHNLIAPLRPDMTDRDKLRAARVGVVLFGLLAYVLALYGGGVYELVEDASSFGSAGLLVLLVFGLFSRFGGQLAAGSALISGTVVWLAGSFWLEWATPYLIAMMSALLSYVAFATIEHFRLRPVRGV